MVYTLPLSCSTARLSYRFPFSSSSSFSKMAHFFLSTASRSFSTTSLSFSTASRSRSCAYLFADAQMIAIALMMIALELVVPGLAVLRVLLQHCPHPTPFSSFEMVVQHYESTAPAIPSHAVDPRTAITFSSTGDRTAVFSSFPPPVFLHRLLAKQLLLFDDACPVLLFTPDLIGGAPYVWYGTNHSCYRPPCIVLGLGGVYVGQLTEKSAFVSLHLVDQHFQFVHCKFWTTSVPRYICYICHLGH